ncbi:unnamed protein product [Ostreobium quekettii]|uniref:Uncharacterized protein n=1 Tax=Ostreobium quekettii TaxID=121088 RepID=A0A8S1JIQ9_9CHLO|nr:unnamed protein product [Ostreobium quekettii]|eukprot:evm.model.scf_872.3 EVM.evm.TU.scf_872.3   scf_872:43025-45977(+)
MVAKWAAVWPLTICINSLYGAALPRVATSGGNLLEIALFRFLVHPVVWGGVTTYYRHISRSTGPTRDLSHAALLLYPHLLDSLYGWFLIFQLGDALGSAHGLVVLVAASRLLAGISHRCPDDWLLKLVASRKVAEALLAREEETQLSLADALASASAAYVGIIVAASIGTFANVQTSLGQTHTWVTALIALAAAAAEAALKLSADACIHRKGPGAAWRGHWVKPLFKCMMPVTTFAVADVTLRLMASFCVRWSADRGATVALELCPLPSLFSQ